MHRFFITPHEIKGDRVTIAGGDFHHITRVLRLGPGDKIVAILPQEKEFTVEIVLVGPDRLVGRILGQARPLAEPPVEVTLAQALVKGDKFDYIIQKATELGVAQFIPFQAEHSVVRLDEEKAEERRLRWQKIAREAAEQSGRLSLPLVREVTTLPQILEAAGSYDLGLFLWEKEEEQGLKRVLQSARGARRLLLVVGPEGGFSRSEAALAREKGLKPVSLGPRILRTETAGPVAVALVLYELGDLGGARGSD